MNTNNVMQGLAASAKKIALASLVFVTAMAFTVIAMNAPGKNVDSIFAAATDVKDFTTCQSNGGTMGCEADNKTPNCSFAYIENGVTLTKGPYKASKACAGCYKGLCLAPCTYNNSDPKGAQGKQCLANNEYCNEDNLCHVGCYGYDFSGGKNGALKVIPLYAKTCMKPGQNSSQASNAPNAVYTCSKVPFRTETNQNGGDAKQLIRNSDGSTTSVPQIGLIYDETDEQQVCNYGDCFNNKCGGTDDTNLCSKTATQIKAAFDKFLGYKTSNEIKIALDKIANDTNLNDDEKTTQKERKKNEYKEKLLNILNSAGIGKPGDDPDSGQDAQIMKQLERMIFPQDYKGATENLLWKVKNDGSLPVVKALKKTQISCQYLNGDVSNRWCPANPNDDFIGYSYLCVDNTSINGCDLFSWVIGSGTEKCKTNNDGTKVNVPAFNVWSSNGFKRGEIVVSAEGRVGFVQDSDGLSGKLTGGVGNGCAYDSYVAPLNYTYNSSTQTFDVGDAGYIEVNKGFTGKCWASTDAQASDNPDQGQGGDNKVGCAAPSMNDCLTTSGASSGSESTVATYSINSYTCQGKKPFICKDEGAGPGWVQDMICSSDNCKNACKCQENPEGNCTSNGDCPEGKSCVFSGPEAQKSGQGTCGTEACLSKSNLNKDGSKGAFSKDAVVCEGSSGDSVYCKDPSGISSYGWELKTLCNGQGCDTATGKCVKDTVNPVGECKDINVTKGNAQETTSTCGNKSCEGVCVPFTVETTGTCSSLACTVSNDYDGGKATGFKSGSGSQWYACMEPKSYSSSNSSSGNSAGSNPGIINYTIKCTDSASGQTDAATGSCGFPQGDDNPYSQKEEEQTNQNKAAEGEGCSKDSDCQSGLVCENGKCMTQSNANKAAEGEGCSKDSDCQTDLICQSGKCVNEAEANLEAPTVAITAPMGTVNSKTAQLSVTTNIPANCKYMDITNGGSFNPSSFAGSGMTMASSGYTHIATLSSLADTAANTASSDCKKTHNIVVLCQNSKTSDQSNTQSIGSAQTSFTVDLSGNTEYAPTVTSSMTETSFTVANPVLKVTTNQPAACQYKEGNTFTYGSGTDFTTTGSYNHNTELSGLTSKDYTYYVVCKDADTCAASKALTINFKVTLESGDSSMTIASATAATQMVDNPTLSVTTDIPATCQYSTASFAYGSGTQFTNDDDYSHTSSLSALADGSYTFYVSCKEKESGKIKALATSITTVLDRGGAAENEPVVSNTTAASQSTNAPILAVTTAAPAKCQYSENEFIYGSGTQFTTDGDTGHSAQLKNVEDGNHTYYVVCKDVGTGKTNSTPIEIVFAVSNIAAICADLDSNDRESDEDRDYDDEDSDSKYAWRSVEDGTRDEFTKVDWYAGYQFTPDKDGYVSQLCGYFEDGQSNDVILYNGSYKEMTKITVEGTGDWACVSITPTKVKTDKRYYVVARVENGPIYYEYQSGLLPADADNVVIESGVRQLADQDFGDDVFKYDYMIFGLVDVKIVFTDESQKGPSIEIQNPIGSVDNNYTVLSVSTDENATCKFSREDVDYPDMAYDFGATGGGIHEQKICKLDDGNFTFYVRCKNENGDENDASTLLQFEVSD